MKSFIVVLLLLIGTLAYAGKYTYVPIPIDTWAVCNGTDRCAKAEDAVTNPDTWEVVADITSDNGSYLSQKSGTRDYESQIAVQLDTSCNYLWVRAKGSGVVWLRTAPYGPVPSNTTASVLFNGLVATDWTWTQIGNRADENLQRVEPGSSVAVNDVAQRDFAFTAGTPLYILAQPSVQLDSWFCSTNANATPVSPGGGAGVSTNYSLYEVMTEPSIDDAQWDRASVVPKTGFSTGPVADMEIKAVWKAGTPSRMCVRGEETLASLTWIDVSTDAIELSSYTAVFTYVKMNNLDRVLDINTWLLGVSPQPDFYDATWPAGVFSTTSDLTNIAVTQSTSGNRRRMQACFDAPEVITTGARWLCDFRQNERITGGALKYHNAFNPTSTVSAVSNWGVCAAGVMLPGPPVDNTPPSVGSVAFANVTSTSFTVTATASDGETGISACYVVYDTTNDLSVTFGVDSIVPGVMSGGSCSATLTGLVSNTLYEAAIYAVNGVGLSTTGPVGQQTTASAAVNTHYISPSGSGTTCSTGLPCALSRLIVAVAGDTWILKNGTYNMTAANMINLDCAAAGGAHSGTSSNPITVQAETERGVWLKGDGAAIVFKMTSCSYWKINGLRLSGIDVNVPGSINSTMQLISSNYITVQRCLFHHLNRYGNNAFILNGGVSTQGSSNNTFIENEFYYFARYAILHKYGTNNVARRNYCNSRGYMDISGGFPGGYPSQGDGCVQHYPSSNNIAENNIGESSGSSFSSESSSPVTGNQFLGNISINSWFGAIQYAKSNGPMNISQTYRHNLMITPDVYGWYMRNVRDLHCEQCTVVGGQRGFTHANQAAAAGSAPRSVWMENVLSIGTTAYGFNIDQTNLENWGINYGVSMAKGGGSDFLPSTSDSHISNSFSTATNQMGNCRVWVPNGATLIKGAGLGGQDIGATILYAYVNSVLSTTTKLWDRITGAWLGAGATIAGTNPPFSPTVPVTSSNVDIDTRTNSAADVGSRLNITASGCLPPTY